MTRLLLNLIGKHQGEVRMRGKKRINFFPSFLRCMGGKQGANPSGGEKGGLNTSSAKTKKKVISKDEGEYVDYEEIK